MRRLVLLPILAVLFLVPPVAMYALASPGVTAEGKLFATVGPGYTITLRDEAGNPVRRLDPGTYTIEIDDRASDHNFQVAGPGVGGAGTTVEFVGTRTITVTFREGQYTYYCDPHSYDMIGQFTVGSPGTTTTTPAKPALPKLVARVGPGRTIALMRGGKKVAKLKPGAYSITVRDRSRLHNFHLIGPGVNRKTTVPFVGVRTWRVTLKRGLYRFRSDRAPMQIRGSVRVG